MANYSATKYLPEPDSAAHRVCVWAYDNRDDTLTPSDIATKFGLSSTAAVPPILERVISAGLLAVDKVDRVAHYHAGPAIDRLPVPPQIRSGIDLQRSMVPAAAAVPAANTAAAAKIKRSLGNTRLPYLDVHAIPIEHGVPMPPRLGGTRGESYWHTLFNRLGQAGDVTGPIDMKYRASCIKSKSLWEKGKSGHKLEVRAVSEQQFRVWRLS